MVDHQRFFADKIAELKHEGRYRVFAELERTAGAFPRAKNHCTDGVKEITVWCSNDYLGMGQNTDVLAAMHNAIFRGGGDYPASRFIIGAGERALMVRNFTGYGTIGDNDQLQLEFGGAYRHYHSCLMRTVLTGNPDSQQVRMHAACVDALRACQEASRPGVTFGEVFDTHALLRQPNRCATEHGYLHAHDIARQRTRPSNVGGRDFVDNRNRMRAIVSNEPRFGRQLNRATALTAESPR